MNKVLVTGANGQLGRALLADGPDHVELLAAERCLLDISDYDAVCRYFESHRPDGVINAAAYTAVDKAETDRELAEAVNARGAGNLARAAASAGVHLVHVSTDFVFDGSSSSPYRITDSVNPINVYGETKARGESAVYDALEGDATVLRTAWVYSPIGSNFLNTMVRLMKERDEINVVSDQIGTPTLAAGLAQACWRSLERKVRGTLHWTDAGVASWYDFAVAIYKQLRATGILDHDVLVHPIPASKFPTAAKRPVFSVLDKTDSWETLQLCPVHWQTQLESAVSSIVRH